MTETMWVATDSAGTTAGFGTIAWQSYLMHKAVKVSQDALEVAQNTLVASEAVAIDAARTRLDAQAPAVTVRFTEVQWPPYAWSHVGMPVSPWPNGYEWHFSEKENDRIVLQARIVIENRGDRYINVEYVDDLGQGRRRPCAPRDRTHSLAPPARKEGRPLPDRVTRTINVHDSRDNGATDMWELDLTGPVRPHESRMAVWLVDTDTAADSLEYDSQSPYERTYWISRRLGSRLPNPTYTPSAGGRQCLPPSSPPQLP